MDTKLIFVADLGLLRAYRQTQSATDQQLHLKLIAELKSVTGHEKLSDQVSVQAGLLTGGEQLKQGSRQNQRLIKQMADKINELLADNEETQCVFVVSTPIFKQLFNELKPKTDSKESLGHFEKANRLSPQSL